MRGLKKPPTRVWLNFYPGWGFGDVAHYSRSDAVKYRTPSDASDPGEVETIEFVAVRSIKAKRKKDGTS